MHRALSMLGLCARAGKLITGEKACVQAIRNGSVHACLIDASASDNAKKALSNACTSHDVPLFVVPADALGASIGKPGRMTAAITDQSMANRVIELFAR